MDIFIYLSMQFCIDVYRIHIPSVRNSTFNSLDYWHLVFILCSACVCTLCTGEITAYERMCVAVCMVYADTHMDRVYRCICLYGERGKTVTEPGKKEGRKLPVGKIIPNLGSRREWEAFKRKSGSEEVREDGRKRRPLGKMHRKGGVNLQ